MSLKKIYLVRHGQTDLNLQGIVQGSGIDSSLNETGFWQADKFFQAYRHVSFDKVYTSGLQRTVQSVQAFIDLGIPHERHVGLNEISWGNREGTRITPEEDVYYFDMLRRWQHGETHLPIEGGESPQQVAERQKPVIELILSRPEEKTILICMHGRAMRVLLSQLLCYPLHQMDRFVHQNLCLYQLNFTGSMFWVERFADVSHLT
ncbi:histidine phosphatase family protein [Rufibacter latericius]|uniref:Histidine phosphatase family protein n=1 Tax=Rufibacter latericius TaxID=2487040 RepID=A0A3M9MAB3_9BACT|nr:histidine phosphatase family protein [Rufibacter latericius]RNI22510.1 histidine phosphatase family protein [Rufibacter latericius]